MKREEITFHDFCVEELNIHSALAPWAVDHTWQFQQKRIDELQAKEKNNGWISVDERLPESGVGVLIASDAGTIGHAHYDIPHFENDWYVHGWSTGYPGKVLFWQPLPPAPEQVK